MRIQCLMCWDRDSKRAEHLLHKVTLESKVMLQASVNHSEKRMAASISQEAVKIE